MSDFISRQAAIEAIERNAYRHTYIEQITGIIKQLPSADVRENVRGEWIEADTDKDFVTCSICKNKGYKDRMAWRPDYAKKYFNFCPNCGAYMRGEDA